MMKMMLGRDGSARDAGAMESDASSAAPRIASVRNMIPRYWLTAAIFGGCQVWLTMSSAGR